MGGGWGVGEIGMIGQAGTVQRSHICCHWWTHPTPPSNNQTWKIWNNCGQAATLTSAHRSPLGKHKNCKKREILEIHTECWDGWTSCTRRRGEKLCASIEWPVQQNQSNQQYAQCDPPVICWCAKKSHKSIAIKRAVIILTKGPPPPFEPNPTIWKLGSSWLGISIYILALMLWVKNVWQTNRQAASEPHNCC